MKYAPATTVPRSGLVRRPARPLIDGGNAAPPGPRLVTRSAWVASMARILPGVTALLTHRPIGQRAIAVSARHRNVLSKRPHPLGDQMRVAACGACRSRCRGTGDFSQADQVTHHPPRKARFRRAG